jgi:hypothetical protein
MTSFRRPMGTGLRILRLIPAYLVFAVAKHLVSLPKLARMAWQQPCGVPDGDVTKQVIAAVVRMRKLLPTPDGDCLQKSLLLYRELSRAGADPVLVVGFRHGTTSLEGHAWIEIAGAAVADGAHDAGAFVPVLRLGPRGVVMQVREARGRDVPSTTFERR